MVAGMAIFQAVWWVLVAVLAFAGAAAGGLSSLVVNLLGIALLPILLRAGSRRIAFGEPMLVLFGLCWLALAADFVLTARQPHDFVFAGNFVTLLIATPVYALARRIAERGGALRVAWLMLAGAVSTLGVCVFDLTIRHLDRAAGFFSAPAIVARLAIALGLAASVGYFRTQRPWRYVFLLGPLVSGAAVLLTGTRGALIAFPPLFVVFVAFVLFDRREPHPRRQAAIFAAAALVLIGLALVLLSGTRMSDLAQVVVDALFGIGKVDGATRERLQFYSAGWTLFWQSPWLGYGWANIAPVAFTILKEADYQGRFSPGFFHFHNDLINMGVGAGAIGIAVYFTLLAAPLVGVWRSPRDTWFHARLYALVALVLLYVITGLTDISFGWDLPTTSYAMLCAILLGALRDPVPLEFAAGHAT